MWRAARRLGGDRRLPRLLFFTDPARTPSPGAVMARLPRGAGVVFRGFGRCELDDLAANLRDLARRRGLVFIVGGDARLARKVRADGLHLPERRLPEIIDRRGWPTGFIVTAAAHGPLAIRRAQRSGVDGVVVSAIFPSASPSAGHPVGVTRLAAWARSTTCAVYALGGVDARTAHRLAGTGIDGLAAIEGLLPKTTRTRPIRT